MSTLAWKAKFPVPEIGYRSERSGTPFQSEPFRTVRNGQWNAVTPNAADRLTFQNSDEPDLTNPTFCSYLPN